MPACILEAATRLLLVEKDTEVVMHVIEDRVISWHGASKGNDVVWSRRVAVLRVVFEDSSIDERPGALVPRDPSTVLAAVAVAPRLELAMEAKVEVLPPRWREFLMLALQNVSAFNETGGDAPAVLLLVPER